MRKPRFAGAAPQWSPPSRTDGSGKRVQANMDLNQQRKALLDVRAQYADLLAEVNGRERGETERDELPVDSDIPTHQADAGTATFERERDDAFGADYRGAIAQIDQALGKIEDGSYGICQKCGRTIPDERLQAMPMALLCIDDQELEDNASGSSPPL